MYIKKLKISHFRKFHSLDLTFTRGLNVVVGPNEAGKSTVTHAIVEGLYQNPATKAKEFAEYVYPWSGAKDVVIQLEFTAGESTFLLQKNFGKNELMLLNLNNQASVTTYNESLLAIEKITNIPSRKVFESTAFVRQSDIAKIETSEDFVNAIQNIAGGAEGNQNVQSIIKRLTKDMQDLNRGVDRPAKNPGPIQTLREKVMRLEKDLNEKRLLWEKVAMASEKQTESKSRLEEVMSSIEEIETLLKNHKLKQQGEKELEDLNQKIQRLEYRLVNIDKIQAEIGLTESKKSVAAQFLKADVNSDLNKLNEYQQMYLIAKQELGRFKDNNLSDNQKVEERPNKNTLLIPGIVLGFSILLTGLLFVFVDNMLIPLMIGVLGVLAAGGVYIYQKTSESGRSKAEKSEDERVLLVMSSLEKNVKDAQANRQSLLSKYQVNSLDDFFAKKAEASLLETSHLELKAKLEGFFQGEDYESLKAKQIEMLTRKKEIEVNVLNDTVQNSVLSSQEYLKKTRELDNLYLEKRKLEEEATESKVRVEDSTISYEDIVILEEDLEFSASRLEKLERKYEVIGLTISGLSEAVKDTATSANTIVSKEIEKYLSTLTKGRYTDARLNDQLEVEVFSRDKNNWLQPTGVLSKGTVDQIYFLTRIAFLNLLVKDRTIPIILDDPFVTFDAARKNEVKEILLDIAERHQIILFSHDNDYASWGNTVALR